VFGALFVVAIVILCVLVNRQEKDAYEYPSLEVHEGEIVIIALLTCIPVFTIISTRIMNEYTENSLQLILIGIIVITLLLAVLTKKVPQNMYPAVIFISTFSLLLMGSLRSDYLIEWADGLLEYWVSNYTLINSYWHPDLELTLNPLLSLSIFPPVITILSGIDLVWVYRIVFPFILSLVVTISYCIFSEQTEPKIAFASSIAIICTFSFFGMMLGLNRQILALLFLVLFIWTMTGPNTRTKQILLLIFGVGIGLSHYGTATMFITLTLGSMILVRLICWVNGRCRINSKGVFDSEDSFICMWKTGIPITVLIGTITIVWYCVISDGLIITNYQKMLSPIINSVFDSISGASSFNNVNVMALVDVPTTLNYIQIEINNSLAIITILGFFLAVFFKVISKMKIDHWALSMVVVGIFIISLLAPSTISFVGEGRFVIVCLYIVAPFTIIPLVFIERIVKHVRKNKNDIRIAAQAMAIIFIIILLIDTGTIEELVGTSSHRAIVCEERIGAPNFIESDVRAAKWSFVSIGSYQIDTTDQQTIYTDTQYAYLIDSQTGLYYPLQGNEYGITTKIENGSYFFLGENNIDNNLFGLEKPNEPARVSIAWVFLSNIDLYEMLNDMDRVYSSDGTQIYAYN